VPDFITSDNAMLAVELDHIADMLDKTHKLRQISQSSRQYARTVRDAILQHAKTSGGIFAYETNGYGGQYIMDDANVPSLVSLPYLGFLSRGDATYKKTKEAMFSRANPYYAAGEKFQGIG
jgi:meiotically up-regulated gene 157 (Mug157) protein